MRFLARRSKPRRRAHIWLDDDTACRMWSTGGLTPVDDYEVFDAPRLGKRDIFGSTRKICSMCHNVNRREEERRME
jgi:hypothetical protein